MATVRRLGFTRLNATEKDDDQARLNHSGNGSDTTKKPKGFRSLFKRRTVGSSATDTEQAHSPPCSASSPPSSTVFWPEEYLRQDIPQALVWTYGYNADAIRRSEIVREQTKLIIFLGTPHRGSAYAGWGQIASNFARLALQDSNKKILETLEVNNEVLDNIHEEFKTIAFKGTMKIHSFQEARGISGMKGLDEKVVDNFSSKLDLPRELETVESIDANHMQMARYSSKDDQGYLDISGVLKAFIRQELESQQIPRTNVADVADAASSDILFMVPFSRDDCFVGREDIIAEVSEHRASQTHPRMALVGLGGVGKSQIAIEYAYRIQKEEPHTHVFWIHASNPTRFRQGYRRIADKLLLTGRDDANADVLQLVYAWFSDKRNGQWLMILDNVDDDSTFFGDDQDNMGSAGTVDTAYHNRPLESFLPQTANGTILITSRNKVAAVNLAGGNGSIVQVEPMGEEDALVLLHTRVPFAESTQADAKALVHALERIPLAITHAAAYIKIRTPATTISTYLTLFRESEANQVRLLGKKEWQDIRRDHSIRDAVIATWQISFKHIQKTEPPAADLLALMSMFDKQGIPKWLLQANTSQLDFDDALAPLLSFSLVQTEIGEQTLEMHRLVQLSMRMWLEAEKELSKWVKKSVRALYEAFPTGDYQTWEECKVLLPHAKEIISHATKDEEDLLHQADSALGAGWYLCLRAEYGAAEGFIRMARDTREKVLGSEHPHTLNSMNDFGSLLKDQGKYEEAEAMHRQCLEGYKKVLGLEHPDTLTSMNNLGLVLEKQGKYEEAEVVHRQGLEGKKKVLGLEHPSTHISMSGLGLVLEKQGKYEEAEVIHQQAMKGHEKVLGPEHPDMLTSVNNLAIVLLRQGKYKEAEAMFRRALEGKEKVLGPEHPDTLDSVHNLAVLFHRMQQYPTALQLYQRAYDGYFKALGAQHPTTLDELDRIESARNDEEVKRM
ncbi:hypothetical protein N0V90_003377 [Kalmusia sp. IMI 367209]|nr:hypothetical protein N0V90_003377 [Kalmusia sp. IMI 367209]